MGNGGHPYSLGRRCFQKGRKGATSVWATTASRPSSWKLRLVNRIAPNRRVLALIALQQVVVEITVALTIFVEVIQCIKAQRRSDVRLHRCRYNLNCRILDQVRSLYSRGGVKLTKNVSVPEQAAMFLSVLSHQKNCVVKHDFIWSTGRPSLEVIQELEKEEPSKGRLQNSLYAIAQVTELKKEEPSKEKLQNSLYAILQVQELENESTTEKIANNSLYAVFQSSRIFKDTIKLALTNFGTFSGTTLPFTKEERHYMDTQGKIVKPVNSKLAISKSTSSNTKNVGITTRNMSKKLKESFQMSPFAEYVEKNLHSPSYASESDATKSPLTSPRSVSSYSFTTNVASIKVTNATTIEEQLASLMRAIEGLTKHVQEPDAQIARLINKADNVDASHIMGKQVEAHDEVEAPAKQQYTEKDKYGNELDISSDGLIPVDQLKEFIEGTIRSKIEGSSKSSLTYSMPYTPSIGSLKMLMGYQPPKFQQFDGKGNPKQHVAHFIETCNNEGTYADYLVKQFVRSLKGNAFDWYTDLEACLNILIKRPLQDCY
ncbi:UNVERIFIED_CONTAM: hypothetical protein Scaly_2993100 [Sesamum calycinum]|uniref:Ty3-gypsy retrotransposon protein n=1 Tax=Sesamum calycinum TaxID=2727403 RepID=A0AAW2KG15_9LAMI